jgi:hypothetical protein
MSNISMQDNLIILNKDNGDVLTFSTTPINEDWKKSCNIKLVNIENNSGLLDINITQEDLTSVFVYYKTYYSNNYPQFFESIGVNRTTTLDYMNIKNLGILDYQDLLSFIHNAKPLTIRDRIAYARRHGWIPRVGHGFRRVVVNV